MNLINVDPFSRFNNQMFLNEHQQKIYIKYNDFFKNSFLSPDTNSITSANEQQHFSFAKNSLLYVITETVADYPYPYLTEKTWKAMLYKMPFMIVGGKHSLLKLKEFGFKTFDNFWDESYDNLDFAADRIDAIINNLNDLAELNKNQIDNLHKEMLPLVEHNQNHMSTLHNNQLDSIKEKIKNL